jgi:hypothetical protein
VKFYPEEFRAEVYPFILRFSDHGRLGRKLIGRGRMLSSSERKET